MKWVRFLYDGIEQFGLLDGEIIATTEARWADVLAGRTPVKRGEVGLAEVELLNPVPHPGKIVAIGLNYLDHCRETNTPPPEKPLVFAKFTTALTDPQKPIVWSEELTQEVDYEGELAVVVGRRCRKVPASEALDYVLGYTAANDVSARDLQFADGQWIRGKSLDTFCPVGPSLVTGSEIEEPQSLAIRSLLNDEVMQDSNTDQMIFPVAELIAFCSMAFTLEPGDLLLTGTPHGVGMSREPQRFMKDGDRITVEIEGIGRLDNYCVVAPPD